VALLLDVEKATDSQRTVARPAEPFSCSKAPVRVRSSRVNLSHRGLPATLRSPLILLLGALGGPLWAPPIASADAITDAKDLFDRGRALRVHGDCASAVPLFRKAFDVYPEGLGSLRNLAECEESLGRFASARRAWLDLGRALLANTAPKYQDWAQDAEQAAARLAPKVATLIVDLRIVAPPGETASAQDVEVKVNGEPLAASLVGTPLERDPATYVVRAGGRRVKTAQEQTVELSPGQGKRVVVDVVVSAESPTGLGNSVAEAPLRPRASTGEATRRTAAWAALGVGAAGLIGAGISAVFRSSALDDQKTLVRSTPACNFGSDGNAMCTDAVPPGTRTQLDSATSRGNTAATFVNVFVVVGAAGLASGLVLLAIRPSASTPRTALVLSPTGVSAVGTF
jgi:hypothetical protein